MMSFSVLNLYPVNAQGSADERFLAEIDALSSHGKIFFTFCEYNGQRYELSTAEPKVQLDISQYSEWARSYLCHLIETEFQRCENDGKLLLNVCPGGDECKYLKNYWIFRTVSTDGRIAYNLSAVRW